MGLFNRNPYGRMSEHQIAVAISDSINERDFEKGLTLADELIRRNPNSSGGYYYKATVLNTLDTASQAVPLMEKAMDLLMQERPINQSDFRLYRKNLFSAYVNAKQIDKAISLFEQNFAESSGHFFQDGLVDDLDFFMFEMAVHSKMGQASNLKEQTKYFADLTEKWVEYQGEKLPNSSEERKHLSDLYQEILHGVSPEDSQFVLIKRGEF